MALILKGCIQENCNGFSYVDTTGPYNEESNEGGYGPENEIESPSDFASYVLNVWGPDQDRATDPPLATIDLFPVPVADDHGFYSWQLVPQDFGMERIKEGIWKFQALANDGAYSVELSAILTRTLKEDVDLKMKAWDPTCPCKAGCQDPKELFMALEVIRRGGVCDLEKSAEIIRYLRSQLKNCC